MTYFPPFWKSAGSDQTTPTLEGLKSPEVGLEGATYGLRGPMSIMEGSDQAETQGSTVGEIAKGCEFLLVSLG